MKVSAYTRSGVVSPSAYYRIIQYANNWDAETKLHALVNDRLYIKRNASLHKKTKWIWNCLYYFNAYAHLTYSIIGDIIWKPDCVIVSREFTAKMSIPVISTLVKWLLLKTSKVIWDFDDDIFECGEISPKEAKLLIKYSTYIVVTHQELKGKLPKTAWSKVRLLPTTDGDFQNIIFEKVLENRLSRYDLEIELIWIATEASMSNLLPIIPWLDQAAKDVLERYGKQLILNIVCNSVLQEKTSYLEIKNTVWSRDIIKPVMYNAHIGIMPLNDNVFNRAKGGFKMIQYMATGMPVIASAVGFNNEIIRDGMEGFLPQDQEAWRNAIYSCVENINKYSTMSLNSYLQYKKNYSYHHNVCEWNKLLEG